MGYTCPKIDRAINDLKEELRNYFLDEFELGAEAALRRSRDLYDLFETYFEDIRSLNSEMRDIANAQISDLEDRISDLEQELLNRGEENERQ